MKFTRKSGQASSYSNMVFDDEISYLTKVIDIFSSAYIPEKRKLTKRQKEFYIITVLLINKEVPILSKKAADFYKEMGFRKEKGEIKAYLSYLEDKSWVRKVEEVYEIPKDFKNILSGKPDTYDFKIKLILNAADTG